MTIPVNCDFVLSPHLPSFRGACRLALKEEKGGGRRRSQEVTYTPKPTWLNFLKWFIECNCFDLFELALINVISTLHIVLVYLLLRI